MKAPAATETNSFKDERVNQLYYYPKEWVVPSIAELKERTTELLNSIDLSHVDELTGSIIVPANADGIGLIPKLSYLGKLWGIKKPYDSSYGQVVTKILEPPTKHPQSLFNYLEGAMGQHCRLFSDAKYLLKQEEKKTPGDVLVLPINFGDLYAGYSARNARWEALHNAQLPLGIAHIGYLLQVMPKRIGRWGDLHINCSGDEYNPLLIKKGWQCCPTFGPFNRWDDNDNVSRILLTILTSSIADSHYGTAVAFLGT